ncbi:NAD(P)/FAD-dependent oxidoreductase [Myxococcota bacterium]|nr:NAD(P)/FAD-dependent oxidoreductase [Myxococcota bacterium]
MAQGTNRYPHLLAPGRIGAMELRNRILMCPMGDNQATSAGFVTPEQIDYFEARARGGAALLLVGSVGITFPEGIGTPNQTALASDDHTPGMAKMAKAVHAHGARLAVQLVHNGKAAVMDIRQGRSMWVPSEPVSAEADTLSGMLTPAEAEVMGTPYGVPGARIDYHVMSHADIATMAEHFAVATERARAAGVDGVEIHAGHGYLIDEFLSPTSNFRTDAYGGTVDNRARFLVEVLEAIRERVGRDYPVWCRLNGEEYLTEGETPEDACRVAELAEAAGADAFHMSAYADPSQAIGYTEAHATHTPGRFLPYAAAVKARVGVPVIAVGRISPQLAEQTLSRGNADFVAMGRALIADPELPNKLAAGAAERVRPCAYHYRCIGRIFLSSSVACVVNPRTGRESELAISTTSQSRQVLVVGGGPAGLEVARISARRGHSVTLIDARTVLGGRFTLAARTAEPNAEVLRWLVDEVTRLGVEVRLGQTVDAQHPDVSWADCVVVATGASWSQPRCPGSQRPHVHTVDELPGWLEAATPDENVVVLGGDLPGLAIATYARKRAANVTVLEQTNVFATSNGLPGRWRHVHEAQGRGILLVPGAQSIEITAQEVGWRDESGVHRSIPADRVLITDGARPDTGLLQALAAKGVEAHAVGDCRSVELLEGAMRDAAELGVRL